MAVYTHVDEKALNAFLSAYTVGGPRAFKGIAEGVENSNYYLDTDQGRYILTLYEKRVNEADLPFFLALMNHMAEKNLPAARPVADREGTILKRLCNKTAALIEFVPGLSHDQPDHHACLKMGAMLARAHQAVEDFPHNRPNDLSLNGWQKLATACADNAERCQEGLNQLIVDELAFLATAWPDINTAPLPKGVIHADFFPDNVLFNSSGEISGLIDFYFSCTDFFVYDIAICINAWCFNDDHQFETNKASAFMQGYEHQRPLTQDERTALPIMVRGAALRFLLTRLYDWLHQVEGALVTVKDPLEYQRKLLFHKQNSKALMRTPR